MVGPYVLEAIFVEGAIGAAEAVEVGWVGGGGVAVGEVERRREGGGGGV